MKAITTRYLGCTDTKGSRFVATTEGGNRITISYDYSLNAEENHKRVALALCDKMKWSKDIIGGGTDKGYVWVFNTPNQTIAELKDKLCNSKKTTRAYHLALTEANDKLSKRNQIIQQKSNDCCKLIELRNELQDKLHRRNMQIKDLKGKLGKIEDLAHCHFTKEFTTNEIISQIIDLVRE